MGLIKKILKWFSKPDQGEAPIIEPDYRPLREFIYLDEVSLQSLLASQKGAMTDQISSERSESHEAEVSGTMKSGVPAVIESELSSRLQTQDARSTQISRKATVQSWFGELHSLSNLRLISTVKESEEISSLSSLEDLKDFDSSSTVLKSERLTRGSLVEMRVVLTADPVFTMKTLITEFSSMFREAPEVFAGVDGLDVFNEAGPINIILQKLLAGLIPIRCKALDHVVIKFGDSDYIVHKAAVADLDIKKRPLEIVGVTEASAYWKDIRRVLYSEGSFTVLARVGRENLHTSWNPVKLVQIFKEIAPTLVDDITSSSFAAIGTTTSSVQGPLKAEVQLIKALEVYGRKLLEKTSKQTESDESKVSLIAEDLKDRWKTASDQRLAFAEMRRQLLKETKELINSDMDLKLRQEARMESGLSFFPDSETVEVTQSSSSDSQLLKTRQTADLIDVEFIAIYW